MNRLPYIFMGLGIILAIGFAIFFAQHTTAPQSGAQTASPKAGTFFASAPDMATATVEYVIDGDTIVLSDGEHVRYIGMNAPEIAHPEYSATSTDECYGPEATARDKELVLGKVVRLERDLENKDRYGRLLRYVWLGDTMIDLELVREGYARVLTIPPDTKYESEFKTAETSAKAAKLGLWSACARQPKARGGILHGLFVLSASM